MPRSENVLPGRLIIVEGIDGSGKSTQLDLLRKWLVNQGYLVIFSEWNSSPIVKGITRRGKRKQLLSPMSFSLIHAADFASRIYSQIRPALQSGAIVLADRYVYTAYARDAVRGVNRAWLRRIWWIFPLLAIVPVAAAVGVGWLLHARHMQFLWGAGVGAVVDTDVYSSMTRAYVSGSTVFAGGDVEVSALTREDVTSAAAGLPTGSVASTTASTTASGPSMRSVTSNVAPCAHGRQMRASPQIGQTKKSHKGPAPPYPPTRCVVPLRSLSLHYVQHTDGPRSGRATRSS